MTVTEAIGALRDDVSDGAAWAAVDAFLAAAAARATERPDWRDDVVHKVRERLEDKLLSGDLPPMASPAAYLATAARNRVRDLVRRAEVAARHAAQAPPPPPEPDPFDDGGVELLDDLVEKLVRRRPEPYRDHLRTTWEEVRRLTLEPVTLRTLVLASRAPDPTDEEAVRKAVQSAHQAHTRLRKDLLTLLDTLDRAQGTSFTAEQRVRARDLVGRLRRRQEAATSRVSPSVESIDAR